MNETEFAELAAGYALNALSPDDARRFADARAQHPERESEVFADLETVAALGESVAEVAPPRAVRRTLLERIAAMPQDAAGTADPVEFIQQTPEARTTQPDAPRRRFGSRGWFALAASLALLVGVGWGAAHVSDIVNTPASVVALQQIQDAPDAQSAAAELADGGDATAYWSETLGTSVLVSDGLPAIADDQAFQMWFVRDGEPISAGTFAAADGTATSLLVGEVEPGDVIAISVEPAGGSPTGAPTSAPIVAIPTA